MLHVYSLKRHVAMIGKPARCADAYRPEEPWLLLHNDGRAIPSAYGIPETE